MGSASCCQTKDDSLVHPGKKKTKGKGDTHTTKGESCQEETITNVKDFVVNRN